MITKELEKEKKRKDTPIWMQSSKEEQGEIEEKNRMGKTRDLFKKIRDTKGKFYANMAH